MTQICQRLAATVLADERGASLVEYALLIAFIAIAAFTAIAFFGSSVGTEYSSISSSMP